AKHSPIVCRCWRWTRALLLAPKKKLPRCIEPQRKLSPQGHSFPRESAVCISLSVPPTGVTDHQVNPLLLDISLSSSLCLGLPAHSECPVESGGCSDVELLGEANRFLISLMISSASSSRQRSTLQTASPLRHRMALLRDLKHSVPLKFLTGIRFAMMLFSTQNWQRRCLQI
ncbi:hypothetical protein HNQ72_003975, partial [Rhizobium wenxiniae]|nr:hypothetical protein [Rhizobium wenxiniae]